MTTTHDPKLAAYRSAGFSAAFDGLTMAGLVAKYANDPRNLHYDEWQWEAILNGYAEGIAQKRLITCTTGVL